LPERKLTQQNFSKKLSLNSESPKNEIQKRFSVFDLDKMMVVSFD